MVEVNMRWMCFHTEAAISEEAWYVAVGERRDSGKRDESRVFAMDRWSSHGSRCRAARRSRRRRLSRRADNRSGIRAAAVFRMAAARGWHGWWKLEQSQATPG